MLRLAFHLSFGICTRATASSGSTRHSSLSWARLTPHCATGLVGGRADPAALPPKQESDLLVALSPHVDDFISRLFGIEAEVQALAARHHELAPLYSVKRLFVQRRALHKVKPSEVAQIDIERFSALRSPSLRSRSASPNGSGTRRRMPTSSSLQHATPHGPLALRRDARGIAAESCSRLRASSDYIRLVPVRTDESQGYARHSLDHLRRREGFALTDAGTDLVGALDEAHYCIWCHEQGKDSCSKGFKEKAPAGGFRKTVFGVPLAGCPLEEKISEFHMVKTRGEVLGALAMIVVDNPMVAATGHRICNDCMKACIYQKQDPVNIPQAETRTLKDVLELPWGFEIYSLLTRWNPLNLRRPVPRPDSGRKVLVAGIGPAGFTLAHHLMNDGHTVVGIDGLKIEPLPVELSGIDALGKRSAVPAGARYQRALRSARSPRHGRLRRRCRVRHHRALGQEFPEADPAAARTQVAVRHVRRRALRRNPYAGRRVRDRVRPRCALRRRRRADGARYPERPRPRRARARPTS
jgi:hypothetical protein